jgi:hypothetical protein
VTKKLGLRDGSTRRLRQTGVDEHQKVEDPRGLELAGRSDERVEKLTPCRRSAAAPAHRRGGD